MDYLDFDLEIGTGNGIAYPVSVRSPAGEVREVMNFPYTRDQIELRLAQLRIALLSSASIARQVLPPELQSVQEMGKDFFNALFSGDIRSQYDQSQRIAFDQGKGLRIRLRIQPAELSALPWEYLYDPRNCEYVCLSSRTPLVRYLEVQQAVRLIKIAPPLRILGMVCSPSNMAALKVEQEKHRVEEALASLRERGQVELVWLNGETSNDLQDALLEGRWHVFHFIGHGDFDYERDEGYLMFTAENGKAHRMHATELARLLADHREMQVVVLNACQGARSSWESVFSSTAAVLVRRGIACAVAMQFSITDTAAVELAQRFYSTLARGLPVDMALTEARKSISVNHRNSVEWGTPVLFMRAPNGLLFQVQVTSTPNKPTSTKTIRPKAPKKEVIPPDQEPRMVSNAHSVKSKRRASQRRSLIEWAKQSPQVMRVIVIFGVVFSLWLSYLLFSAYLTPIFGNSIINSPTSTISNTVTNQPVLMNVETTPVITSTLTFIPTMILTPAPTPVWARISTSEGDGALIRAYPNYNSEIIQSLLNGALVEVLSEEVYEDGVTWVHVRLVNGKEGWIARGLLRTATPVPGR